VELLVTGEGSYVMEQVLCEPVELTEFELDEVVGGNPFNVTNNGAFSTAFDRASFAIGAVQGDFSTIGALATISGQVNTGAFGTNSA
jgi:hypothetical protein